MKPSGAEEAVAMITDDGVGLAYAAALRVGLFASADRYQQSAQSLSIEATHAPRLPRPDSRRGGHAVRRWGGVACPATHAHGSASGSRRVALALHRADRGQRTRQRIGDGWSPRARRSRVLRWTGDRRRVEDDEQRDHVSADLRS